MPFYAINNSSTSSTLKFLLSIIPQVNLGLCLEQFVDAEIKGESKLNQFFLFIFREAKLKRALRVHFLTHFTKNFCFFLTPKVKSGTDIINPSIESSEFLFWHEKF